MKTLRNIVISLFLLLGVMLAVTACTKDKKEDEGAKTESVSVTQGVGESEKTPETTGKKQLPPPLEGNTGERPEPDATDKVEEQTMKDIADVGPGGEYGELPPVSGK